MPCCRRKRNRLATAPRARQGVNLTRGVGRSVLLIYAPVARSRGLFKESWTFLSFIRRNNLATETSQRRVKRASASTSSRWLPAALFLLLFYASSGPAASSQLHAHAHTHAHASRSHLDSTTARCPPVEFPPVVDSNRVPFPLLRTCYARS